MNEVVCEEAPASEGVKSADSLVEVYKKNETEIDRLSKMRDEEGKRYEAEARKIHDWYWRKTRALEDRKDNDLYAIQKERTRLEDVVSTRIETLYQPIKQIKRILTFLRMETEELTIDDEKLKQKDVSWRETYFEPLGYLIDDDFLKVRLYITDNSRPKNKFTLAVVGICGFPDSIIEWRHGYVHDLDTWHVPHNIVMELKVAASIEELKIFLNKRREHLISLIKQNYDEVKAEYLEVISTFKLEDFEDLEVELEG